MHIEIIIKTFLIFTEYTYTYDVYYEKYEYSILTIDSTKFV